MIKIIILLAILLILLVVVISRISKLNLFSRVPKLLIASIFVFFTLIFLLSVRFLNDIESKGTYIPAKYDGVDLIPGKVEVEK
jgi:energy-coupling factor transporter transmembrane protein EcfT